MSAGDGIRCPACDGDTGVVESRPVRRQVRRRRRCLDPACTQRLTTIEMVAPHYSKRGRPVGLVAVPQADDQFAIVVVPRGLLDALRAFVDLAEANLPRDVLPTDALPSSGAAPEGDPTVVPVVLIAEDTGDVACAIAEPSNVTDPDVGSAAVVS